MKTFKQFQEQAALAAPLIGAGIEALAPLALPIIGAATHAAQDWINQANRQPQGAIPRTPNVQRPSAKDSVAERQRAQAAQDRRREAQERAAAAEDARQRQSQADIDKLLGSDAERRAAAEARARNAQLDRQRRTRERMSQAGQRLGLPEQVAGSGGSPYEPYNPEPGKNVPSKPTQPPEGFEKFREKWGIGKPPIKQAQQVPPPPATAPDGKPLPLYVRGEKDPGPSLLRLLRAVRVDKA